jgi:L-fuculose-phosphate aldolase
MNSEMPSEKELRESIIEIGRRLWQREYVAANDGNITARLGEGLFLCTPSGVSKGFMTPEMLLIVDKDGRVTAGEGKPSSELKMHLRVYQERPDVGAVVHAHPPAATGFAVAGIALTEPVLPEVVVTLGGIPLVEYATPSTNEVPERLAPFLKDYDAFLLANHGVLTLGSDLFSAYYKMETVEHCARVVLAARQLGGARQLSSDEVRKLEAVRESLR